MAAGWTVLSLRPPGPPTFVNLDVNPVVSFRSDQEQMPALFRIRHDRTRSQEDVSEVEVTLPTHRPFNHASARGNSMIDGLSLHLIL